MRAKKLKQSGSVLSSLKSTLNKAIVKTKVGFTNLKHKAKITKAKIADKIKPKEIPRTINAKMNHINDLRKKAETGSNAAKQEFHNAADKERPKLDAKIKEHFQKRIAAEEAAFKSSPKDHAKEIDKSREHFRKLGLEGPALREHGHRDPKALFHEASNNVYKKFDHVTANHYSKMNPTKKIFQHHISTPQAAYAKVTKDMRTLPASSASIPVRFKDMQIDPKQYQSVRNHALSSTSKIANNIPVWKSDNVIGQGHKRKRGRGFWDMMGKLAEHQHDPVP